MVNLPPEFSSDAGVLSPSNREDSWAKSSPLSHSSFSWGSRDMDSEEEDSEKEWDKSEGLFMSSFPD